MNKDIRMLTKFRHVCATSLLSATVIFSPVSYADDSAAIASALSSVSSAVSGLSGALAQIKAELTNFYNSFKQNTGINAGDYTAPTIYATPDLATIKSYNQGLLDAKKDMEAFPLGKSMSDNTMVNYMTTPFTSFGCNNCESSFNVLPATSLYSEFLKLNLALPYDLRSYAAGLTKMAPFTGKLARKGRDDFQGGKFADTRTLLADTLLAPRVLNTTSTGDATLTDMQLAEKFVQLSGGILTPIKFLDFLPSDELTKLAERPRDKYLMRMLNYVARESVGVSNLYQIYAARIKPDSGDKSPVELEYAEATRRLDPSYHDKMEKASPPTVQRELLYLMSEMNYQLYQQRRADERLLATVSMIQLQLLEVNRGMIEQNM